MTAPLRKSCAWCHPPGSPGYDGEASHSMCPKCARHHLLELPLLAALATLRGPAYMGDDDRAKCARLIDTVICRLNREDLNLFHESPLKGDQG